jgi:TPR repeat protein
LVVDRWPLVAGNNTLQLIAGRQAMRIDSLLSVVLLLAGLSATRATSQDAAPPRSQKESSHSVITNIFFAERAGGVDVEVAFSTLAQPVHPEISTLEHPDRLVFDFPGCDLALTGQRLLVNRGPVRTVRAAQFSVAPLIARVVIDLQSAQDQAVPDHEEKYVGNKLVIRLNWQPNSSGSAPPATPASAENTTTANSAPLPSKSDRAALRSLDSALPKPMPTPKANPQPPALSARAAAALPHAYVLLNKARDLTLPDLEALEAKAKTGDPEAETTLALAYHAGTLLKVDDAEALRLLQHAANRGYLAAEEAMGIFCQSGFGMAPDKAQAVAWYDKAAQHGSLDAATNLALMYSTGDGTPKDKAKAATWFRKSAEAGDATAELNLAVLYHRGEGVPKDDAQAELWLTRAADQGLLPAMLQLATWKLQPEHGFNVDAAIVWYKKAAEQGDASAQVALGDIFSEDRFHHVDYPQALGWYRKAAEQGRAAGQFGLGARYLLGQGVPRDPEEARRWLTPAANQGHPYAQYLLAKMFEEGEGGPVDVAAAAKYYELAANYGLAKAQYRLGLLLSSDRNNATRLLSAYKWFVLAQDSVKESAATAEDLRKLLTPEQLDEAGHEIDEWHSAHQPRK